MSAFNITRTIVTAAIIASATLPAAAASDRSGKFTSQSWPEETIYRPECRIVQSDGSWLPCGRDW
jgi:hypothetical protein